MSANARDGPREGLSPEGTVPTTGGASRTFFRDSPLTGTVPTHAESSCRPGAVRAAQPQAHERAAAVWSLRADPAAVRLRHLLHDREPQAGARQLASRRRPIETVEDVRQVAVFDARPVVPDDHLPVADRDL